MPTLEDRVRPLLDHAVDRPSVDSLREVVRGRRKRRRLARGGAVLVLAVASVVGVAVTRRDHAETVSAGPPTTTHLASRTFRDEGVGLSFEYPASWAAEHFDVTSSFSFLITYVSNQKLHDPCTRTAQPDGGEDIACGSPMRSLMPDGVLVEWSNVGAPGPGLDLSGLPGTPTTIGGRPAHVDLAGAGCTDLTADRSITAWIAREPGAPDDNLLAMTACFRGPDLAAIQSEVEAMLASVTFPTK